MTASFTRAQLLSRGAKGGTALLVLPAQQLEELHVQNFDDYRLFYDARKWRD